jgi:hypothetical protein
MKKKATIAGVVICLSVACLWLTTRIHSRREPTYGGKPVRYWARQSRHAVEDDSVRVLRQMGDIAVPYLTNQLTLKAYSLALLGPLAKDAVPALKGALNDSDPEVKRKALEALQKLDPAAFKSVE